MKHKQVNKTASETSFLLMCLRVLCDVINLLLWFCTLNLTLILAVANFLKKKKIEVNPERKGKEETFC